jgi:hypothetical protein
MNRQSAEDRAFYAARRAEKWKAVWMVVLLFAAIGFGTIFLAAGLEAVAHAAMAILVNIEAVLAAIALYVFR